MGWMLNAGSWTTHAGTQHDGDIHWLHYLRDIRIFSHTLLVHLAMIMNPLMVDGIMADFRIVLASGEYAVGRHELRLESQFLAISVYSHGNGDQRRDDIQDQRSRMCLTA